MPPPQRSRGWDYGRSRPPWSRSPESGARRREVQSPLKMGPSPLCRRKRQHFGTSPRTRRECGRSVQPEFAAKRFDLGRTREQENPRSKISRRKRPSVPRAIPPSGMRSTILTIFGKREECLEDAAYGPHESSTCGPDVQAKARFRATFLFWNRCWKSSHVHSWQACPSENPNLSLRRWLGNDAPDHDFVR